MCQVSGGGEVAGVISHCGHWHYWHGLVACPVFGDVSIVTCHECRVSSSSRISCYREGCIITFSYFFHLRTTLLTNEWIYLRKIMNHLSSSFCLLLSSRNPVIPLLMNLYGVVWNSASGARVEGNNKVSVQLENFFRWNPSETFRNIPWYH